MSYVFIPNKEFLFCPACNSIGNEDGIASHLMNFHQWTDLEINNWFITISSSNYSLAIT